MLQVKLNGSCDARSKYYFLCVLKFLLQQRTGLQLGLPRWPTPRLTKEQEEDLLKEFEPFDDFSIKG